MPLPLAIVFDFDGVIANSEPIHLRAWRDVLAGAGIDLDESDYYAHYLGYDDVGLIDRLVLDRGLEWPRRRRHELLARKATLVPRFLAQDGVLFPSAVPCIRRCAEVPLAIASGALRHEVELVIDAAGLRDLFPVIVGAGDTARSKPAPDPYARAVALLQSKGLVPDGGASARRCVAIEDSRWGIESAHAAGLACAAVTTSYPAADLPMADLLVSTLDEITLDRLSALVPAE